MEFASSDNKKEVMVVWRRGSQNPPGARVKMKWNEGAIEDLTHLDNGYYNLRKGDNTLIWRTHLTVEGNERRLVDVLNTSGPMKPSHSFSLSILSPQPGLNSMKDASTRPSSSIKMPELSPGP